MIVGIVIGAINGALIVLTGVPDIVVTLAMSFVWGGVALLIMRTPGGGSPIEFQALGTGTFVSATGSRRAPCSSPWCSRSSGCRSAGAAPASPSTPSAPTATASYLSGVNVAVTRVLAYAIGGFFAAHGRPRRDGHAPASARRTPATSSR